MHLFTLMFVEHKIKYFLSVFCPYNVALNLFDFDKNILQNICSAEEVFQVWNDIRVSKW